MNEDSERVPVPPSDPPAFRYSLSSLFGLITFVAVLAACVKCGGSSGVLFGIAACIFVAARQAARQGRRRVSFWYSYLSLVLVILALFFKFAESAVRC